MAVVSFIIPHYNSSKFLSETISSLYSQVFPDFEVIVVDDGSIEIELNELYKLKDIWPHIRIYQRPYYMVKGANSCRNFGLTLSRGEYVNFVDSDDVLLSNKIESQMRLFDNDSSLGMVVCKTMYFRDFLSNHVGLLQKLEYSHDSDFLSCYLSKVGVWCTNSALIKKSALLQNKFKEGQIDAHEWLFFLNLMLDGVKVSAVNEVLVLKRIHSNTIGNIDIKYKIHSLLEARLSIFSRLVNFNSSKKNTYIKLLLADINSLLRTTAKCGQFKLFFTAISFINLSIIQMLRAFFFFFVFWIFKKGDSFSVISSNE